MRAWNELRWTIAERHRGDVGGGGIRRVLPRRRNTRAVTIGSQPRHRAIRRADRRALVSSHGPRRQSTEEGRRFFEEVRPLLTGIEDAASVAAGAASHVRGRLRINSDAGFGQFVLAPNLHKLLSIYPELEVELAIRERPGDLVADGFDLAIRFGEPEPSSLIGRKILETRVLTCAAPSYLDRAGTPKHPRDLANHECIQYREPLTHRHYRWVLQGPKGEIEVATRGRLTVTDAGALLAACVAGHGIAQPLELHARRHLDTGRLVQLLPRWAKERFPLFLYLPTRKLPSAKTRAFLNFALSLADWH
jgi:DNA-binding transcriptional LysR family regulator